MQKGLTLKIWGGGGLISHRHMDISDCRVTFATEKFILPANIEIILKFWVFTLGTRQNVYRCDRVSIELLSLLEFCWSVFGLLFVFCWSDGQSFLFVSLLLIFGWSFVGLLIVFCWSAVGHLLILCRSSVGLLFIFCWSSIGLLFIFCWSSIGLPLVFCWSSVSLLLVFC